MDTLVLTTQPADAASWPANKQLARYERTVEWHDFARGLNERGALPWAWGSHSLLHSAKTTARTHVVISVYQTKSLEELDRLMDDDPLRDFSEYLTIPLTTLDNDFETDRKRLELADHELIRGRRKTARAVQDYEANYRGAPDYAGKYPRKNPANRPVDFNRTAGPGDKFEVLLYGTNPDQYIGEWSDLRKHVHYKKVLTWHDYVAMLTAQGKLSHVWGTHGFCSHHTLEATYAGAVQIFQADDFDDFDEVYRLDPIRESTIFLSVALRPIADQRAGDVRRLEIARQRLR